jgi:hypothetical protein
LYIIKMTNSQPIDTHSAILTQNLKYPPMV